MTVATLVDRMKINGSLARQCIADLEEKGMIKPVVEHSKMKIYSMFLRPWKPPTARTILTDIPPLARAVGASE